MDRGQRIALGVGGVLTVGSTLLYWRWISSKKELPPPKPLVAPFGWQPGFQLPMDPHAIYASLTQGQWVEDIGGGWFLLDASAIRDPKLNPEVDAHVKMTASLILQNKNAPPMVFNALITNISGDDYAGSWATKPPANGPQMPVWRGANIFALHK